MIQVTAATNDDNDVRPDRIALDRTAYQASVESLILDGESPTECELLDTKKKQTKLNETPELCQLEMNRMVT